MQLAQSYLQGMASPFDGVLEAYGQGQTLRQNRDLLQAQQAEQARKIQAQQALETIDWNDKAAIARTVAQFPEYTKGAKDYYDALEQKEQQALLFDMSTSISALGSDRPDIAVQKMRDKATAYNDAGNEEKAEEYSQMAEWMARDPKGARQALLMNYATIAPKDAGSNFKSFTDASIAENESPYTINEKIANAEGTQATAQKTRAETNETVSEGLSTAAIGGNAGTFSLKAGMMHAQGLITDAQKQYIDEQLNNDDPEAVQVFLEGLAGQSVEIAKLNKPEVSVVNAGGQLVAIKKNADGTVELVGSVDKTVSPDVEYAQDSATNRTVYTVDQQAENARQSRELQAYLADQDAKIKSGEVTQQVMPDGRVLLWNKQGQWKEVIDKNGKPMISKPSVADKPLNESQGNSLMYGKRMQTANKILENLESTNGTWDIKGGNVLDRINPKGGSEDFKKYEQAKRNFINAVLRKESGAAIGQDEFDSADKQYFPQIGDSEAVIKQKAANRRQVTNTMLSNVGPKGEAAKKTKPVKTNDLF